MRHEHLSATTSASVSDTLRVGRRSEPEEQPNPPCHDARVLTSGGTQAEIRLDGIRYLLRITRQGKLILTK